jgi:hypothetical protein
VLVHFTDPHLADSDGDGYSDKVEVDNETDPNDIADYPPFALPLRINEFLANNNTGLNDGNGNRTDWIEIFNPNPESINLPATGSPTARWPPRSGSSRPSSSLPTATSSSSLPATACPTSRATSTPISACPPPANTSR